MNTDKIDKNWTQLLEYIRDEYNLTEVSYNTWIRGLKLGAVEGSQFHIVIPSDNSLMLGYYNKKYREFFEAAISEQLNAACEVLFVLPDSQAQEDPSSDLKKSLQLSHAEAAGLNPRYRFDTFVVGSNNRLAQAAGLAVAESPGNVYNPLFLYGGAGLGKTHLIHSIGHFILEQNPETKVLYVTSEQFTNEVIEAIRSGNAATMSRVRDKYRTVDVLLIDDIQFIIGKESTQEEFFHTFNVLHAAGKQIVLSSDRPPKEMETLDERFRSRFEMGLIADIQPPDYETRMAILRRYAEEKNKILSDDVLDYVAKNLKSNIRELEGAVNTIIAYSKLNNREVSTENMEEALKDHIYTGQNSKVTPRLIAQAVCEHYDVKMSLVASRKKSAEYVLPRQVIMYLCRKYTDSTLENIARLLGKKDHTTVIHGIDKISDLLDTDDSLRNDIDILTKKLNL